MSSQDLAKRVLYLEGRVADPSRQVQKRCIRFSGPGVMEAFSVFPPQMPTCEILDRICQRRWGVRVHPMDLGDCHPVHKKKAIVAEFIYR